jgi:hypothetical protein
MKHAVSSGLLQIGGLLDRTKKTAEAISVAVGKRARLG